MNYNIIIKQRTSEDSVTEKSGFVVELELENKMCRCQRSERREREREQNFGYFGDFSV